MTPVIKLLAFNLGGIKEKAAVAQQTQKKKYNGGKQKINKRAGWKNGYNEGE